MQARITITSWCLDSFMVAKLIRSQVGIVARVDTDRKAIHGNFWPDRNLILRSLSSEADTQPLEPTRRFIVKIQLWLLFLKAIIVVCIVISLTNARYFIEVFSLG